MFNNREAVLYFSLGYVSPNGVFYSAYIQFSAASVSFTQGKAQIHCDTDFTSYPATALQQFEMNTPSLPHASICHIALETCGLNTCRQWETKSLGSTF